MRLRWKMNAPHATLPLREVVNSPLLHTLPFLHFVRGYVMLLGLQKTWLRESWALFDPGPTNPPHLIVMLLHSHGDGSDFTVSQIAGRIRGAT